MSFIKHSPGSTRAELLSMSSKNAVRAERWPSSMQWKIYVVSPLDWGWESLPLADQGMVAPLLGAAREFAGWDGSFREWPRYFASPGDCGFATGVVWKQDHAGVSFVAVPAKGSQPYAANALCVSEVVEVTLSASLIGRRG